MMNLSAFGFAACLSAGLCLDAPGVALTDALADAGFVAPSDLDSDRDGLSDFHERHKYFTDPARADTDGDGISDGDWNERREHAYSLRTITHLLRPITLDVLCDDYQDARVLHETDSYVELEVVAYPQNTVASAIVPDPNWRMTAASMPEWTRPGLTANWDEAMRDKITAGLKAAGIDPGVLSDKELVERAAPWLLKHAKYTDGFTTFCSEFRDGRLRVYPGLEEAAREHQARGTLTIEEQWDRELLARGMFEHGVRGSCSSSAIYMNGCLRALGIPTRIVLAVPVIDGTDPSERTLVDRLSNNIVRSTIQQGTDQLTQGWSSHTFNEVFVGGRWRRLNYDRLGQNILDSHYFGLMIHVATFSDWADGNLAATWGVRQLGADRPSDIFGGSNPYSTITISDQFGPHAKFDNPAAPGEFVALTIDSAVWYAQRPEGLELSNPTDPETAGHVLVRVVESVPGRESSQYASFYRSAGKRFVLRAPGKPDVPINAERGYWADPDRGHQHFYLRIAPKAFATMAATVPYTLHVGAQADAACRWTVQPDVTLVKPEGAGVLKIPATITIRRAIWSDANAETAGLLEGLGPVILIGVGPDSEFQAFKRFCEATDRNFVLESPGHPPVRAAASIGGVNLGGESHGVLVVENESWKNLLPGVDYALRPANGVPAHTWVVAEGIACRR